MKNKLRTLFDKGVRFMYQVSPTFIPIGNGGQPGTSGTFNMKLFGNNADLPTMLNVAFQMALSLGAVLAVLRIAYAGYLYMGQSDMWSKKGQAKEVFENAIVGLLLLFSVWLVLNQINPDLLNLDVFRCLRSNGCPGTVLPGGVGAAPY